MFLAFAALIAGMQTMPDLAIVEVKDGPRGCVYRTEGRRLSQAQLEHRAKVWAGQGRIGEVHGNRNTPYRCVGTAMAIMQDAGMEKVSFIGKPIGPSVMVGVQANGCMPTVNGDPVTMAAFRTQATQWGRKGIEIHFAPDPEANDECVDSVLTIFKETSPTKLSFVGNEAPAQ